MTAYDRSLTAPVGFYIDMAEFLGRLARDANMRADILIAADEEFRLEIGQRNVRRYPDSALRNQARLGGIFNVEVHVFNPAAGRGGPSVDSSYMIKLEIGPFTVDVIGVATPLNARSEDGWRPYYGPRKPSWDPAHGLPNPLWRGKGGYLTVFTEDPWLKMRVNPAFPLGGSTQVIDIPTWVAIGDFMAYVLGENVKIDSEARLTTYLNRKDGKLQFTTGQWFGTAWYDLGTHLDRDQKKEASFRSANGKYYFFDEDPKEIW
jgi:hypothetical protein